MKFDISKNELIFLVGNTSQITIQCETGILSVTQSGDARDYVLRSGDIFTIERKAEVGITGHRESTINLLGKDLTFDSVKQQNTTRLRC